MFLYNTYPVSMVLTCESFQVEICSLFYFFEFLENSFSRKEINAFKKKSLKGYSKKFWESKHAPLWWRVCVALESHIQLTYKLHFSLVLIHSLIYSHSQWNKLWEILIFNMWLQKYLRSNKNWQKYRRNTFMDSGNALQICSNTLLTTHTSASIFKIHLKQIFLYMQCIKHVTDLAVCMFKVGNCFLNVPWFYFLVTSLWQNKDSLSNKKLSE